MIVCPKVSNRGISCMLGMLTINCSTSVTNFALHPSLLKNSFVLSCALGSVSKYDVFVAFWSRFRALLGCRPGLHLLFQQCPMALAGPPRSHENGSVANAIFTPG